MNFDQNNNIEKPPKDVSNEFLSMEAFEFSKFLTTLRNEPLLVIDINWKNRFNAFAVKAFLEKRVPNQKREATIRATKEQHDEAPNVFASGVKWIEIK